MEPTPFDLDKLDLTRHSDDLFIFACGFEDRAQIIPEHVLNGRFPRTVVAITYENTGNANLKGSALLKRFKQVCCVQEIKFSPRSAERFISDCANVFDVRSLALAKSFQIDISAMSQFLVMLLLRFLRGEFFNREFHLFYVAAKAYYPPTTKIKLLLAKHERAELRMSEILSMDEPAADVMFENMLAGSFHRIDKSCLMIFCGYELNRSLAAYNSINPTRVVFIHSVGTVKDAEFRAKYSKMIHEFVGGGVSKATETVCTMNIGEQISLLREYYHYLGGDHDMVLAPVHSKMEAIAALLFVEEFPDVQVVFPVPVSYSLSKAAKGVGEVYSIKLPPIPGLRLAREGN
tara:strand:+ start:3477 stop:4517 length:1041 start_codon:yes stop_codon:yes gene_type:complete